MSRKDAENIAIIGSGPAGWSAAIYAVRGAEPIVIEGALTAENQEAGTLPMGQLATTTVIENYPGFPIGELGAYLKTALDEERTYVLPPEAFGESGERIGIYGSALIELVRQQALNFGARTVDEDVVSVDFTKRPLSFAFPMKRPSLPRALLSRRARLCAGLTPSEECFKNNGVGACAVCDGLLLDLLIVRLLSLAAETRRGRRGVSTKFASKVYVVHRRDELRASKILASRAASNPKIEFLWNRVPSEILGNDEDGVTGVLLTNTLDREEEPLELETSGVFVAIGRRPNVGFLDGALELTEQGNIKRTVPFQTNTSVPGSLLRRRCRRTIPPGSSCRWIWRVQQPWTPNVFLPSFRRYYVFRNIVNVRLLRIDKIIRTPY